MSKNERNVKGITNKMKTKTDNNLKTNSNSNIEAL